MPLLLPLPPPHPAAITPSSNPSRCYYPFLLPIPLQLPFLLPIPLLLPFLFPITLLLPFLLPIPLLLPLPPPHAATTTLSSTQSRC